MIDELKPAHRMDALGKWAAKIDIAMLKVAVPAMSGQVIDWAIQAHGGGTSNDLGLARALAMARVQRLADGPDEVHGNQIGKLALRKYACKTGIP